MHVFNIYLCIFIPLAKHNVFRSATHRTDAYSPLLLVAYPTLPCCGCLVEDVITLPVTLLNITKSAHTEQGNFKPPTQAQTTTCNWCTCKTFPDEPPPFPSSRKSQPSLAHARPSAPLPPPPHPPVNTAAVEIPTPCTLLITPLTAVCDENKSHRPHHNSHQLIHHCR